MKILIIGATGTIGKEITKLSHDKGYRVIAASRNGDPSINIDDPVSLDQYFDHAPDFDAIICVAGSVNFGKVTELTDDQIELGINSKLLGQVNVVRKGLKKLKPKGVIILTGGFLAYNPWPETSNIAMVNAGLEGFVRAAALDLDEDKRVLIVHPPFIKETAIAMGMDGTPWPTAATAAFTYLSCLANKLSGIPIFIEGYAPGQVSSESH